MGLRAKAKLIGQAAIAIVFAVLALQFPDDRGVTPASSFVSFIRITIRFWIICGICVAAGIGIFYAEWVTGT